MHCCNGVWGLISTGFLASPSRLLAAFGTDQHVGWFYSLGRGSSDAILLANQVITCLFILGWTFVMMVPFFIWLNYMGWFRVESAEEIVGLDISYHGGQYHVVDEDGYNVTEEQIEAYNRHRKNTLRRRRRTTSDADADGDERATAEDMSVDADSVTDDARRTDRKTKNSAVGGFRGNRRSVACEIEI